MRVPLKHGSVVKMPNGGQYIIREKIGEGGLSLIYAAETRGNGYPVIIKEFFPSEHAHRAERTEKDSGGRMMRRKDRVCPDSGYEDRFDRCLRAFEQEGQLGSSARMSNYQIISFSDCGNGYAVLPRWSGDSRSFEGLVSEWRKSPPGEADPVFPGLGRLRFALAAVSSLLTVLSSVHAQNMLHLDISPGNVVWAGGSASPENGAAFLTDFGCSVLMEGGAYPAEYVLSYSREYAAPEYTRQDGRLDRTTDIYSVGRLLIYLCLGQRAFFRHSDLKSLIEQLHIPREERRVLYEIVQKATDPDMDRRYRSAAEMQEAVTGLLNLIPARPCNPDNTKSFTLHSLRAMLEGSPNPHYSWAHELRDRRGASSLEVPIPDSVCKPAANVPGGRFADDTAFLRAVLPEEIFDYLEERLSAEAAREHYLACVMAGNCPKEWKAGICGILEDYGLKRLAARCGSLLHSEQVFREDVGFLFRLPGEDIRYFEHCCAGCGFEIQKDLRKGLALLVIFALLGQGESGFASFAHHSPSEICKLLRSA